MGLLTTAKDLLSQQHAKAFSSEEVLGVVLMEFVERNHPVKKAERAMARASKTDAQAKKKSVTLNELVPGAVAPPKKCKISKEIAAPATA